MNAIAIASTTVKPKLDKFLEVPVSSRRYSGHGEDYVTRFQWLVRKWRAETMQASSLDEKFHHPAYAEVVAMGRKAVPLIVAEIQSQPDWLFGALNEITGEDPVAEDDRGDIDAMISAWIQWASERG